MTCTAELTFLKRLELYKNEKPFQIFANIPPQAKDRRQTNIECENIPVVLNDIREKEVPPTLDDNGFTIRNSHTSLSYEEFSRAESVESRYFAEMEAILRAEDKSIHRIFLFDWRLRSSDVDAEHEKLDLNDMTAPILPAKAIHVDQSPAGVVHRVLLQMGDDAAQLLQGRVRIINLWRPLLNPVEDYPLVVCDGSTVDKRDLIRADNVRLSFKGESLQVHHRASQKWFYLSEQKQDEVLLLKIFDSEPAVKSTCCPHGAVKLPNAPEKARPRRSVEVRALVFG